MNDVSLVTATLPATTPRKDQDPAQAATEVFARMFVKELQRGLPDGGLLGADFAPLEQLVTDALVHQLTQDDSLGLGRIFADTGTRGTADAIPVSPTTPGRRAPLAGVADGPVSSAFGMRVHPISGELAHHDGIDIAAPAGSPIRAARAGVVVETRQDDGYGNLVVVDHGNGLQTRYAHCDTVSVQVGQAVQAGDTLATVGATGRTTGPHLHFEVRASGRALDPGPWIRDTVSRLTLEAKDAPTVFDTQHEDPGS